MAGKNPPYELSDPYAAIFSFSPTAGTSGVAAKFDCSGVEAGPVSPKSLNHWHDMNTAIGSDDCEYVSENSVVVKIPCGCQPSSDVGTVPSAV